MGLILSIFVILLFRVWVIEVIVIQIKIDFMVHFVLHSHILIKLPMFQGLKIFYALGVGWDCLNVIQNRRIINLSRWHILISCFKCSPVSSAIQVHILDSLRLVRIYLKRLLKMLALRLINVGNIEWTIFQLRTIHRWLCILRLLFCVNRGVIVKIVVVDVNWRKIPNPHIFVILFEHVQTDWVGFHIAIRGV